MLVFKFHKEIVDSELTSRPRLNVRFTNNNNSIEVFALLDSGADRTVLPKTFAKILGLKKGKDIETAGIGGITKGFESLVDLTFIDILGKQEKIIQVPIYVLEDFNDVIIGRNKIFDKFRIVLEQFNNKIILEKQQ